MRMICLRSDLTPSFFDLFNLTNAPPRDGVYMQYADPGRSYVYIDRPASSRVGPRGVSGLDRCHLEDAAAAPRGAPVTASP